MADLLIDPDCAAGKCSSCMGGPCEHHCHQPARQYALILHFGAPDDEHAQAWAEPIADHVAAEYGTRNPAVVPVDGELYDHVVAALADQVPADEYSPEVAGMVAYIAMLPALANLDIALKDARAELAEASDALRAVGKAALTVAPTLREPYRDAPDTSPWQRFMEEPARRAYNLGVRLRRHMKETPDA